jgi:hypothetical protein
VALDNRYSPPVTCAMCVHFRIIENRSEGEPNYNTLDKEMLTRYKCSYSKRWLDELVVAKFNYDGHIPVHKRVEISNQWTSKGDNWSWEGYDVRQSPYMELPNIMPFIKQALMDEAGSCQLFYSSIVRCGLKCGKCKAYDLDLCQAPAAKIRRKIAKGGK